VAKRLLAHYINQKAMFTDWEDGRFGKALRFDGKDDYVQLPDFGLTGSFTLSFG